MSETNTVRHDEAAEVAIDYVALDNIIEKEFSNDKINLFQEEPVHCFLHILFGVNNFRKNKV